MYICIVSLHWMVSRNLSYYYYLMRFFFKKRITENQSNLKELAPLQFEVPTLLIRVTMAGCGGGPPKGSQQYALYDSGHWAVLLASNGLSHLVALALAFTVFFICIVVSWSLQQSRKRVTVRKRLWRSQSALLLHRSRLRCRGVAGCVCVQFDEKKIITVVDVVFPHL